LNVESSSDACGWKLVEKKNKEDENDMVVDGSYGIGGSNWVDQVSSYAFYEKVAIFPV
jgi:hypothetical protein